MPIYEYECVEDGSVVEVMRPMGDADKPLADPEGKGRKFVRKVSLVSCKGGEAGSGGGGGQSWGGGCGCGKGGCGH